MCKNRLGERMRDERDRSRVVSVRVPHRLGRESAWTEDSVKNAEKRGHVKQNYGDEIRSVFMSNAGPAQSVLGGMRTFEWEIREQTPTRSESRRVQPVLASNNRKASEAPRESCEDGGGWLTGKHGEEERHGEMVWVLTVQFGVQPEQTREKRRLESETESEFPPLREPGLQTKTLTEPPARMRSPKEE